MRWKLVYRVGSPTSEAALHYVEARLQAYNEWYLDEQLKQLGMTAVAAGGDDPRAHQLFRAPVFSLAALIPLILVLMTVTGAVYPAIDLTAGERERGTLETLIAAPVPRLGLLMAKYVAVLVVALLTALVNLAGMTVTAHSTGLAASLFGGGMSFEVVLKVLLLLGLFAAFFSAILLALTSCARSFKEAQAYIIPLMLLCLVPGVLCLMPGLEFKGWMAVTPLVNIVMLARDLLGRECLEQFGGGGRVLDLVLHCGGDCAGRADLRHRRDSVRQPGDVVRPGAASADAAAGRRAARRHVRPGTHVLVLLRAGHGVDAVGGHRHEESADRFGARSRPSCSVEFHWRWQRSAASAGRAAWAWRSPRGCPCWGHCC